MKYGEAVKYFLDNRTEIQEDTSELGMLYEKVATNPTTSDPFFVLVTKMYIRNKEKEEDNRCLRR